MKRVQPAPRGALVLGETGRTGSTGETGSTGSTGDTGTTAKLDPLVRQATRVQPAPPWETPGTHGRKLVRTGSRQVKRRAVQRWLARETLQRPRAKLVRTGSTGETGSTGSTGRH